MWPDRHSIAVAGCLKRLVLAVAIALPERVVELLPRLVFIPRWDAAGLGIFVMDRVGH